MNTKEAIEFVEDICESLSKQCDSGSGSDDADTVMMKIEAGKVIDLLKRGEKYEKKLYKTLEVLKIAVNKFKEYATEDTIANLYGYGCFGNPHKFIKNVVEKANKIIMEEVKNE